MKLLYKLTNHTPIKDCNSIPIEKIFDKIRSGQLITVTQKIRKAEDGVKRKELKQTLASFLPSICSSNPSAKVSNGVVQFDLDLKDNDANQLSKLKHQLGEHPNILFVYTSPSGGLKFAIQSNFNMIVPSETKNYNNCFKVAHQIIAEHVMEQFGKFAYDPCSENIMQTCYLAHDEDALFVKNPAAYQFTEEEVERIFNLAKAQQSKTCEISESDQSIDREELLHLLRGVPTILSFDERRKINFTLLYYLGQPGIDVLKDHWVVEDSKKLNQDLHSQLCSVKYPCLNYLKSKSSNYIPAKNSHLGWCSATPSEKYFRERPDITDARSKLADVIDGFFASPKTTVVKAPCGIGKSTHTASLLAETDKRILYLAPTHDLAEDVRQVVIAEHKKCDSHGTFKARWRPTPTHIYGRGKCRDGVYMCENEFVRKDYISKSTAVPVEVCKGCPLYPCRYTTQFNKFSRIRFSTHFDLVNHPSNWENGSDEISGFAHPASGNWKPELIIIDESFISSRRRELTYQTKCHSLRMVLDAFLGGQELLECLQLFSKEIASDYMKIKKSFHNDQRKISATINNDHFFLSIFASAISKSKMTKDLLAIGYDKRENPTRLVYDPLPVVHERFKNTPMLIFDATASKELYDYILNEPEFIEIEAHPKQPFKVFQCQNLTFSKSNFSKVDNLFDELVKDINEKIHQQQPKKIGLISYKKVSECNQECNFAEYLASKLNFQGDCVVGHFGNIRGRNHFDECDILFVVGRHAIQQTSSILFAQQLYGHQHLNTSMGLVDRTARFKEEDAMSLSSYGYTANEMRTVSDAFGTAETIQAIFRLRPFSADEKTVYFYSNLGLGADISVDGFFDVELGEMAKILEGLRSTGFCQIKPSELIKIGFNQSQSRAGRRENTFRHLKQRGVSIYDLSLRLNGKDSSHQYLVYDMKKFETYLKSKRYRVSKMEVVL